MEMNRVLSALTAAALCCALAACSAPDSSSTAAPSSSAPSSAPSSVSQPAESVPVSSSSQASSAVPEAPVELSSDLASLQFCCNGRVCTLLDTTVSELGLHFAGADLTAPVEPWTLAGGTYRDGGIEISEILNPSDEPAPAGDCVVMSLWADLTEGADFQLPGGIALGSTPEQVEAAWGPATRSDSTGDSGFFLQYYLMDNGNADSLVVVDLSFGENGLESVSYLQNIQLDYWNPFELDSWQMSVM